MLKKIPNKVEEHEQKIRTTHITRALLNGAQLKTGHHSRHVMTARLTNWFNMRRERKQMKHSEDSATEDQTLKKKKRTDDK